MEVEGVSPDRVDAVEAASVVSGQVDASGNLVLTTKGGQQKNAGSVVKPLFSWPVGSVYIGMTSTDPKDLFGGGTWARIANGRVLVGVDPNDADFNAAAKTGGAKTHTLSPGEMPVHNHGGVTGDQSNGHLHSGYTTSGGEHEHIFSRPSDPRVVTGGGAASVSNWNFGNYSTGGGGAHSHTVQTNDADRGHTHSIGNSGGGAAHNNMQPYFTVFIWQRTA